MKNIYLPEAKSDIIFAFISNVEELILVGVVVAALITGIVLLIHKRRKDDKK